MKSMKRLIGVVAILTLLSLGVATSAMADFSWTGTTSGQYQRGVNTSAVFDPNGLGTTITGTLDLTNMALGDVMMFGLIDKKFTDSGGDTWQSGAYGYFYKKAVTGTNQLRVGVSDGNLNGAVISGTAGTAVYVTYQNTIDFVLHVQGGTMTLSSSALSSPLSWNYGTIKTLNNVNAYAWAEFADGAYLGYSNYAPTGGTTGFNVSAAPAVVPIPAAFWLLGSGLLGLIGIRRKLKKY
jgi:hypothetical protein